VIPSVPSRSQRPRWERHLVEALLQGLKASHKFQNNRVPKWKLGTRFENSYLIR
jgi:hypothetical protein